MSQRQVQRRSDVRCRRRHRSHVAEELDHSGREMDTWDHVTMAWFHQVLWVSVHMPRVGDEEFIGTAHTATGEDSGYVGEVGNLELSGTRGNYFGLDADVRLQEHVSRIHLCAAFDRYDSPRCYGPRGHGSAATRKLNTMGLRQARPRWKLKAQIDDVCVTTCILGEVRVGSRADNRIALAMGHHLFSNRGRGKCDNTRNPSATTRRRSRRTIRHTYRKTKRIKRSATQTNGRAVDTEKDVNGRTQWRQSTPEQGETKFGEKDFVEAWEERNKKLQVTVDRAGRKPTGNEREWRRM